MRTKNLTKKLFLKSKKWFRVTHHHVAKKPHNYLSSRFFWYKRWHEFRWHPHVHYGTVLSFIFVMVFVVSKSSQPVSALSTWQQNNWSDGVGPSGSSQFVSAENIDFATPQAMKLSPISGWFDSGWSHRTAVNFNNTTANIGVTSEELLEFPVLVTLTSDTFDYSLTQGEGQDLRFTDASAPQTALPYEIDTWDATGTSYIWVEVPQISIDSSTDFIYMYYGNSNAVAGESAADTWNNNYAFIHHFEEPASTTGQGSILDSTANNQHGTPSSGVITGAAGFIGKSADVSSGTGISLGTMGPAELDANMTLSFWVNTKNFGSPARQNPFNHSYGGWGTVTVEANGELIWFFGSNGADNIPYSTFKVSAGRLTNGTWLQLALTRNAIDKTYAWYVNGLRVLTGPYTSDFPNIVNREFLIGDGYVNPLNGSLDEFRLANISRSTGWMAADYKSQTGGFSTLGQASGRYQSSGVLTSNIFNSNIPIDWGILSYTADTPSGSTLEIKLRSGNQANLSDSSDFSTCSVVLTTTDATSACAPDATRYAQYQVRFTAGGSNTLSPNLQSISINYSASDIVEPTINASSIRMFNSVGGSEISSNAWTNVSTPYLSWTAGQDDTGGSGIMGYCAYLGQDATADPVTTKGLLGSSAISNDGCQFITGGESLNLSTSGLLQTALATSNNPYYLRLKAIDNTGNVFTGVATQFQFRYDNEPPVNPAFISAPSQFIATKNVTLSWPTAGADSPRDDNSGLLGLQYRIGNTGVWYGDNHNGAQNNTDLLANDGAYATSEIPDFDSLIEGNNIIYFRTFDTAGNISTTLVTTVVRLNTTSPGAPQNTNVSPAVNTENSFSFSWVAPSSFAGSESSLTYCYTINVLPTATNCNFTSPGVSSLSSGAYATQPGENSFYVVAKDEAGNINYATAASTVFTANTSAPGMPLNSEIADVSTKSTASWKLALTWESPSATGAGIATYIIFRSANNTSFSQIATTSGLSYVDTNLEQKEYFYKVSACDSANNCGAYSSTFSKLPTGRFTEPPELVGQPSVQVSTRTAKVTWITDRESDSRLQFGTIKGTFGATEAASSDQTKVHTIDLENLDAGITYRYKARWTDVDGNLGTSTELSFTTLPAPAIKDVVVRRVTLSSAIVQFTSENATIVKFYYGKGTGFGGLQTVNTSRTESTYTVELTGLDDGTTYNYKINPLDDSGNEYDSTRTDAFSTPPRPRISNVRFQPVEGEPTSTQQVTWTTNVPASSLVRYSTSNERAIEVASSTLVSDHNVTITNLLDDRDYVLIVESRDNDGNLANSDDQTFRTALDTRPPTVKNVTTETTVRGSGSEARGQIIVSWQTDEPASSQVFYGQGSGGNNYESRTAEDTQLVTEHVVIISDLSTSQVYHVQPVSFDKGRNKGSGKDSAAIIDRAVDGVLDIIINTFREIFGA